MKRLLPIILILALLLTGCGAYTPVEPTPQPTPREDYAFSPETFPEIVCAPSLLPLGGAAGAALLGLKREEGLEYASQSVSGAAWESLADGGCSLVLALPAPERGAGIRTAEVAKDALVFFVSPENPVNSLTAQQLRDVYTGRVTNWKQLGGRDVEIKAFTKNDASGSQAALKSLVLNGASSIDGPLSPVSGGDMPAAFDNSEGAIGFGTWYYESVMGMAEGCKIIKVEGVEASAETIAAGDYPLVLPCLAGIREDAAEDSPEFILWQWLQNSAGQRFIASQGYVSAN